MIDNLPAWKNGEFCQLKDLNVSILDLGLIHCDATYDVISSKDKKIFMLDQHLDRFYQSCSHWRLNVPLDRDSIKKIIIELCKKSEIDNLLIWMAATRGIPDGGNPRDLRLSKQNFFIYVKPYFGFNKSNSATVCVSKSIRIPDFSIKQKYKNFAWNDLTLAQWEALDRGYDSALLLDFNGNFTEGPGFNVFFIKDNTVITPEKNCLEGVTIKALEKVCESLNYNFIKTDISLKEADKMDFIGLASTAGNLIPVTKFENKIFQSNKVFENLQKKFEEISNDDNYTILY